MAACRPTGNHLLLLSAAGLILLSIAMLVSSAEACPQYCLADVAYTTCTASGDTELEAYCNCCFLKGAMPNAGQCTLHLSDGTEVTCS